MPAVRSCTKSDKVAPLQSWTIESDNQDNLERLFKTPDEDIIWTENICDLVAELERRHPGPEMDLKYVVPACRNDAEREELGYRGDIGQSVQVRNNLTYVGTLKDGADLARLLELAKKYRKIRLASCQCLSRMVQDSESAVPDLLVMKRSGLTYAITDAANDSYGGLVFHFARPASRYLWTTGKGRIEYRREAIVTYDPGKAKKLKSVITTQPSIIGQDVLKLLRALSKDLFRVMKTPTINVVGLATDDMCAELRTVLSYYQLAFGKGSYLSVPEFQSIAKRWSSQSHKHFAATGENGSEFAEWMNKQSKKKIPMQSEPRYRLRLPYPK